MFVPHGTGCAHCTGSTLRDAAAIHAILLLGDADGGLSSDQRLVDLEKEKKRKGNKKKGEYMPACSANQ